MKIVRYDQVPAHPVAEEGAVGVTIRWLISKEDAAPNFSMRHFEIAPRGYTPHHCHDWEHEVFILRGEGKVLREGVEVSIREGDVVFIPPGEEHQFRNDTDAVLTLLCLIPNPG